MKGTIYAVGVGPGDPELLTLKAIRTIENCPCIAVPHSDKEKSAAYKIAGRVCDLSGKPVLEVSMPMSKDPLLLAQAHKHGAQVIAEILDQGTDVAFLTLGDPSIYATTSYIVRILEKRGYPSSMVSGVPSFAAAAARLGISLGLGEEEIHILPGTSSIEEALRLSGTKIIMKIGTRMEAWKDALQDYPGELYVVENCGMPNEQIYRSLEETDHKLSYFTILVLTSRPLTKKVP